MDILNALPILPLSILVIFVLAGLIAFYFIYILPKRKKLQTNLPLPIPNVPPPPSTLNTAPFIRTVNPPVEVNTGVPTPVPAGNLPKINPTPAPLAAAANLAVHVDSKPIMAPMGDAGTPFYKKSGFLIVIFVFLLIAIPTVIYFGVKRQQSLTGKAADPPGCCDHATGSGCSDWEECAVNNGSCSTGYSCRLKSGQCKNNGGDCTDNWQCCSGNCQGGKCQGPGGEFTPRTPNTVCTEESGSVQPSCALNCASGGGVCCDKGGTMFCCYGDSSTRKDGACYQGSAGGVTCSGSTITNNSPNPITLKIFKGGADDIQCPISRPGGNDETLAVGASRTANCEQIDAPGFCGVCSDSSCNPPGDNPTPTPTTPPGSTPTPTIPVPTPTPTIPSSGQCTYIRVYNESGIQITDFSTIVVGQVIRLAVMPSSAEFTHGRFQINNGAWMPGEAGTNQKNAIGEFYQDYTVQEGITSFTISAMVKHPTLGWK